MLMHLSKFMNYHFDICNREIPLEYFVFTRSVLVHCVICRIMLFFPDAIFGMPLVEQFDISSSVKAPPVVIRFTQELEKRAQDKSKQELFCIAA